MSSPGWAAGAAGPWRSDLPAPSEDGLKTVVLVQAGRGGRILGVRPQPKT